jgi:hypothetical protein
MKMQNVAESKRNMKVDMRPAVLAKTMTKELALITISVLAVISKLPTLETIRSSTLLSQGKASSSAVSR